MSALGCRVGASVGFGGRLEEIVSACIVVNALEARRPLEGVQCGWGRYLCRCSRPWSMLRAPPSRPIGHRLSQRNAAAHWCRRLRVSLPRGARGARYIARRRLSLMFEDNACKRALLHELCRGRMVCQRQDLVGLPSCNTMFFGGGSSRQGLGELSGQARASIGAFGLALAPACHFGLQVAQNGFMGRRCADVVSTSGVCRVSQGAAHARCLLRLRRSASATKRQTGECAQVVLAACGHDKTIIVALGRAASLSPAAVAERLASSACRLEPPSLCPSRRKELSHRLAFVRVQRGTLGAVYSMARLLCRMLRLGIAIRCGASVVGL